MAAMKKQFKLKGVFFTIYEFIVSNPFCEVTDSFAYSSSKGDEKQGDLS